MEITVDEILNINRNYIKPWSSYSNYTKYQVKEKIRAILSHLSGNDMIEMLIDILNDEEKDKISEKVCNALKNLSFIYYSKNVPKKYQIASALRRSKLPLIKLKKLGYNISKTLWAKCKKEIVPKKLGTNKIISKNLINQIRLHLENISSPSADRSIKLKRKSELRVNVRYLNCTFIEAYRSFQNKNQLSFNSFLKYMPKEFKKPFRLTDLCSYCEYKREIIQKLKGFSSEYKINIKFNSEQTIVTNINEILYLNLTENLKKELNKLVGEYKTIEFHRKLASTQREAYNNMRKNKELLKNSILIDFDFKQKIVIGLSPRQKNEEFYEQKQRSLLGFGIYYLGKNNEIELINTDIVYQGTQEAINVVRCFRFLREQSFFKDIEKSNYILWCDTGKHFRCAELAHYFLGELAGEKIHVNLNFFTEKHGKNSRDQHFSTVTTYVKQYEFRNQILCSNDIVNAINDGQIRSNESNKAGIKTIALELIDNYELANKNNIKQCFINIPNIERFYNYRTIGIDYKIKTSYISNNENLIEIDGIINRCETCKFEKKKDPDIKGISLASIVSKMKILNLFLKKISVKHIEAFNFFKNFFIDYLDDFETANEKICKTKKKLVLCDL